MPRFLSPKIITRKALPILHAEFGTLNKLGAMRGNKETAKGKAMQIKHVKDLKRGKAL